MNNAEKFKSIFGLYATELWAMSEESFVSWLNSKHKAESDRKWIPLSEKLPPTTTDVLVTVLDDSGDTSWKYTSRGWLTPDGQYWIVDYEICYGVIAWMPLPEPYKGDR